jgi:hypothetical protein
MDLRRVLLLCLLNREPKKNGDRKARILTACAPGADLVVGARFLPSPSLDGQLRER